MKILIVHPGASVSTADVYNGIMPALQRAGHEVWRYNLDARIASSGMYLNWHVKRANKHSETQKPKPTPGDVLLHAAQDVLARALWNDIELVLVVSGMYLHPDYMILMRKAGLRLGVMLTESPYDDVRQGPFIQHADIVWTNERTSVNFLRQWNPNVFYLPHAFDPDKHSTDAPREDVPGHDVLFVGTGFQERIDVLSAITWDGIDAGIYGTWELLGNRHRLRKIITDEYVDNRAVASMYKRSAINLNIYRTSQGFGKNAPKITDAESLNPRALELAACGAFTLSDAREEVSEVFGDLVPTFRNPSELQDLIGYYLSHPEERQRKAAQLPQAVAGWTFDARAAQMARNLDSVIRSN